MGDRIENLLMDILSVLIQAAYSRNKGYLLREANLKPEQMRYLMRLAKDLRLTFGKRFSYSFVTFGRI